MKLSTLLKGVKCGAFKDVEIERVTDKDKETKKNTLFICINGNQCDGHKIALKALEYGAVAIVTEQDLNIENQIIVENSRKAYSIIAGNFYGNPAEKLKIIGITGTNGKTSTAFIVKRTLEKLGVKCGLVGTVENFTGSEYKNANLTTPEPMELHSLLKDMVNNGCEYCVMEVSSQALSQERVYGIKFSASAITNITPEHLDYHLSMENYIRAKLEICKCSAVTVINTDDENICKNADKMDGKHITVSAVSAKADFTAMNILCSKDGIKYELVGTDTILSVRSKLLGQFSVYNTMIAVILLLNCGFDEYSVSEAVSGCDFIIGRAEKVEIPKSFTVMIDYAHTPDGIENILKTVSEYKNGRIITVFGCGGDRDKTKRSVMGKIAGMYSDTVVVTSDNPRTENPLLIINDILYGMDNVKAKIAVIENRYEAIEFALKKARKNDIVLLLGKGHEKYQIIGNEKIPFDEREFVHKILG